jgi:hypothetical protein
MEYSEFTKAYLEAMDFTELGEEGQPPVGAKLSPPQPLRGAERLRQLRTGLP